MVNKIVVTTIITSVNVGVAIGAVYFGSKQITADNQTDQKLTSKQNQELIKLL